MAPRSHGTLSLKPHSFYLLFPTYLSLCLIYTPPLSCDSSSLELELESHVFKICRTILPSEKIIHMCYFLQKCLLRCLARKPQNEQIPHATCNGLRMHRSDVHFASDKVHLSEHTAVSQQIHNPKEVSETRPIFVKQQSF